MSEELKLCPFCGSHPKIKNIRKALPDYFKTHVIPHEIKFDNNLFRIVCGKCGKLGTAYMHMEEAIKDWNMRVTHNTRSSSLKPCPFCGGEAWVEDCRYGYYVSCQSPRCLVSPETGDYETKAAAIAAWNLRADDA